MCNVHINKIEKIFFSIISIVFHPIFIPTFLLIIVFNLFSEFYVFNKNYLIALTIANFVLTTIIPIIILGLLHYFNFIKSFYLKSNEERILVSLIMTLFYFLTFYFMQNVLLYPQIFIAIIALPIVSTMFSFILLFYPKISMHTFGIGSLLGIVLFYKFIFIIVSYFYFIITIIILVSGFIITSRLVLNAHKLSEVLIGYFSGILCGFILTLIISQM